MNTCLKVARELQEYPFLIGVAKAFATLLQGLEMRKQAYDVLEFIRDVCEETYNY